MLIDAFMYLGGADEDILEIRLRELDEVVSRFVIVESCLTFTGNPKPFHLDLVINTRFAKWAPRITRVLLTSAPDFKSVVDRENWNRNCIARGLNEVADTDVVITGDVDEIPRASVIAAYNPADGLRRLGMTSHYFYLNCTTPTFGWDGARICSASFLRQSSPLKVRHTDCPKIENAGWHFSSMGGAEKVAYKLSSFAHYNLPHNPAMIQGLKDGTWVRDQSRHAMSLEVGRIDDSYPRFVYENVPLMKEWGLVYEDEKIAAGKAEA